MAAYYNEFDRYAAAWLRELIKAGLIADGEVDERSIVDVRADDIRGFTQCHFFAGIGGWSYALRLSGWADERHVWTGSCPCQPFSAAGKGDGAADSRHLWPTWFELIRECRPPVVFGEQVASADGLGWLDRVSTDMEATGYAVASADLCAASVGAFHIRQRLYFVADTERGATERRRFDLAAAARSAQSATPERQRVRPDAGDGRAVIGLADSEYAERRQVRVHREDGRDGADGRRSQAYGEPGTRGEVCSVAIAERLRSKDALHQRGDVSAETASQSASDAGGASLSRGVAVTDERGCEVSDVPVRQPRQDEAAVIERGAGFWRTADWIPCADGKWRPVEPGTFPLAHGIPGRVGRLRGYGNAIVPQVAQAFIEAYLDARGQVDA